MITVEFQWMLDLLPEDLREIAERSDDLDVLEECLMEAIKRTEVLLEHPALRHQELHKN